MRRVILLTGATGLIGGRTLALLLQRDPGVRVLALTRSPTRWAEACLRHRIPPGRVEPVMGDLTAPGLGLDAGARLRLANKVTGVIHAAADVIFSRPLAVARVTNVEGTRNLLDLMDGWAAVERMVFVSTAFVAGRRRGAIGENATAGAEGWVNSYEQSKHEAEALVRTVRMPAAILRSSTVVLDATSGGVTQFNAAHMTLRLLHAGLVPMLPGSADTGVDLVTADYVCEASARAALAAIPLRGTYHLCAGAGALPLGELIERSWTAWSTDPDWRRRAIPQPALVDLDTYRLFEETIQQTADDQLRRVVRGLSFFAPQLALAKCFDTTRAAADFGPAPAVAGYWPMVLAELDRAGWLPQAA